MKTLKILLGNNTLSLLAGSETWTYTLALALRELGHHVTCYAPELGLISEKLLDEGIKSYNQISPDGIRPFSVILEENIDHKYDVIIANHFHVVEYLRIQFPKTPIISTIHGIIHIDEAGQKAPEHPALHSGVAQFVAVSEEVQKKLLADYQIASVISRNFFDIKKHQLIKAPNSTPKQFLVNTNYAGRNDKEIQVIRDAAKHFGAKVAAMGQNFSQSFDLSRVISDSDVVFGMGRSVLEGVAAGRLGIVHGRWGTGGVICESNLHALREVNFSGRNSQGKLATAEELIKMIEQYYNPLTLDWGKKYIARDHNAIFAAEAYVRLARELTGELVTKPILSGIAADTRPFKLAKS